LSINPFLMSHIPFLRLKNHKITHNDLNTAQALVAYLGAVQAQDYPMSKWAIGLRVGGATDAQVEAALDTGALVRTHVLRPTWHIVSGHDVRWMLALTAKHIRAASAARDRDMGIDQALYTRCNDLIVKSLEGGKYLTREALMQELEKKGIETNSGRMIHFMMNAEVEGIVCNGKMQGNSQTYALMDEKVPKGPMYSREESISILALRYFTSHGPAMLQDFHWWSGLPMPDARMGMESIKKQLQSFESEGKTYWLAEGGGVDPVDSVYFLPSFDEYTVSYKDRAAVFAPQWQKEAITINGIFKPMIVVNGRVTGIWKRTIQKNRVLVEPAFFDPQNKLSSEQMERAIAPFGAFLKLNVQLPSKQ
jgi:Winged helix DNA-binding domain